MVRKLKGGKKVMDGAKVGVDPSLGKETEDITSVANLEAGLTLDNIGKKTSALF